MKEAFAVTDIVEHWEMKMIRRGVRRRKNFWVRRVRHGVESS